jgi:asparagine synthase (glutamine-hydrolysing)
MTAIYGILRLDGAPVEPAQLEQMARALQIHEPGHHRAWTDRTVGLGAGVVCPAPGDREAHRPAVSGDGNLVVVCDGHVDNRRDLGVMLGIPDLDVQTMSGPALVLRAYQRWEDRCLDRLVGDFTFVLWDKPSRALLAGSSAPLARPLYYHAAHGVLSFASRARGLFALAHVPRRIDEQRVAGFLTGADTGRGRSFFRDVQRLLPGHLLKVDLGHVEVTQWWLPDLSRRLTLRSDRDYVDALEVLLRQVIGEQLRGSGSTGILLSGGLDSGSVAAVAAPLLELDGRRLAAYTEVPRAGFSGSMPAGRYADETPFVEALAGMYSNLDLALVRDCRRGLLEHADRLFSAAEAPFRNAPNRGWIEAIYERAADHGVRTLLNGDHGNLTVSWPGSGLLPELLRQGQFGPAIREARLRAKAGRTRSTWRALAGQGVLPLLPISARIGLAGARGAPDAPAANPYEAYSLIAPTFAAELKLADRDARTRTRHFGPAAGDPRSRRLGLLVRTAIGAAEIGAGYRTMLGIDTRTPLADRRLVEFCLQLPETQCARAGEGRLLIRRAMAGRVPAQTLEARQRGVQAAYWFERMRDERQELLGAVARFESDDLATRVLDLPRLRRLLEQWPNRAPCDAQEVGLYRGAIGTAMMTGSFLLWAQNRP